MNSTIVSTVLAATMMCIAASCTAQADEPNARRQTVVVELFTSEGCSSCPPADDVLAELSKAGAIDGVEIVPLGLHVDYWNYLGWSDRFASAAFSKRQQAYAQALAKDDIYTPQMIVDGTQAFVGSDRARALAAIALTARQPKGQVAIKRSPLAKGDKSLDIELTISNLPARAGGQVMLAVIEDQLSSDVQRGENAGRRLPHSSVVRLLKEVGTINPGAATAFVAKATVPINPAWRVDHVRVAAFVQQQGMGRILAAGQAGLEMSNP